MRHLKQCRALVRRILRAARWDSTIAVYVYDEEGFTGNDQNETDIINTIFDLDESFVKFVDLTTGKTQGCIFIVLDYDREPGEIVSDYTANRYTEFLITKAESKI
tara:strand:- start:476 stop:790 length:315 start_codon:yes stop_codon:yes gene_type:complete